MARGKRETIMKSVGILLAERMGLQKKERKFVGNVNAMLRKIGYEVVSRDSTVPLRGRRRRVKRGPGRPRVKPTAARKARSGRPRKKK
ncbi:MAG: hypothetical protein V3S25_01050 [Nitrospirales bacterium]